MSKHDFDYIIAGAGCSGLSLAVHLIRSGSFSDKQILLVDNDRKNTNDRTWCFWETGIGNFDEIVYKEWSQVTVKNDQMSLPLGMDSYKYKLIRGIDFYKYCDAIIAAQPNFHRIIGAVESFNNESTEVTIDGRTYSAQFIFNSILQKPVLKKNQYWMLQHFRGWRIKTKLPSFDPEKAILMDFRTFQHNATAFFYVLPFSATEALIEYTLFSNAVLEESEYEQALRDYISGNVSDSYEILEREAGVIPMTNAKFAQSNGNIVNIGSAGGQTKGSSGYTFQFIQKNSNAIVVRLQEGLHPKIGKQSPARFHFYDSVLLDVLQHRMVAGSDIFSRLFAKNKASKVLRFLDNESTLADEIIIISKLPTLPFLKAAIRQLFGRMF